MNFDLPCIISAKKKDGNIKSIDISFLVFANGIIKPFLFY